MKKRVLAIVLAACTVFSMVGCGKLSEGVLTINKYKGLEIEKQDDVAVTDEDVENSIASTLDSQATYKKVKRAVKSGDFVTLDYSGKMDGKKFDGGTAEDYELEIGSGTFIPGFEEAIVGHKTGQKFDIDVTFPEEYPNNPDMAGKPAVFTIKIKAVKVKQVPELTMDLIKELGSEAESIEAYKEEVKKDLEESNKQAAESAKERAIWTALIENCVMEEYPADLYNEIEEEINNQYGYMASMYGMEVEDLVQNYFGLSVDAMIKNLMTQQMAVELIAKKEKLTVSDKEYTKEATAMATEYGYEDLESFEEMAQKDAIKEMLVQQKVSEFLMEHCVEVEKKADETAK